jgi:putative phosphoribosyl transferase
MEMNGRFRDRAAAGRSLAELLAERLGPSGGDAIVFGLPRGGVPVAYEVARRLESPLDVLVVRKLGVPHRPELGMGAVASGGVRVLNEDVLAAAGLDAGTLEQVVARESAELRRREASYRGDRQPPQPRDRMAILVDDGLATGSSMLAAVQALRSRGARKVVVAVPVAPPSTCDELADEVDEIVCAHTPASFVSVGSWYEDFAQTSDEEVRRLLAARDDQLRPQAVGG